MGLDSNFSPRVNLVASSSNIATTVIALKHRGHTDATLSSFLEKYATGQGSVQGLVTVLEPKLFPTFLLHIRRNIYLNQGYLNLGPQPKPA